MNDARAGCCLCCNQAVLLSAKEWDERKIPAVLCQECAEKVIEGEITWREVRMTYTLRSQIGWLFEEYSKLRGQFLHLCSVQQEVEKALLQR